MAGHSKWANIKHKKSKEDAKRGQIFTKIARQITVAVKEGGPDVDSNFRLRLAIDKAREANMPNDNIERAIQRGVGGGDSENYEEVVYEGYGPNGVAVMIQAMTDNRNRTASELRHAFSKHGGNLGESGCVAWMFDKKGVLLIAADDSVDEDELMMVALEAGAEDVIVEEEGIEVVTSPSDFQDVKTALEESGYSFSSAEVTMVPQNTVEVDAEQGKKVIRLTDALEDLDDVQEVYTNADIPPEAYDEVV
ncbi:MAG: YebC/PmpR family DNA-binding transcriptional regulator [Firmicutes bacterium]|nr:YebC/PmpR family DNA-binding transcriptional regulator [Bacillota bacterium]